MSDGLIVDTGLSVVGVAMIVGVGVMVGCATGVEKQPAVPMKSSITIVIAQKP
jgi:hypothetical protein